MVIFCVEGVAWDIRSHGNFSLENYGFTRMFLGCVVVGLGFGIPSIVYRRESLPMPIRVLIHMGIGCIVYTITAFAVGWIGGAVTIGQGILAAAMQFAPAFAIWLLFMRYYRAEARRMNERMQKMKGK